MKKFFVLAACLLVFCGCSKKESGMDKKLIGTWQEVNNPKGALIFQSDHTGLAYWPDDKGAQQGSAMNWKIIKEDNKDKVSVITPPGPVNFEISDQRLLAPNGVVLTKIK